jgi:hypothetical protein
VSDDAPPEVTEVHVIQFASGFRLPVAEGMTTSQAFYQHQAVAVTEGVCPHHGTALAPEPAMPGIGGFCVRCYARWGYQPDADPPAVTWDRAVNPITGDALIPPWAVPGRA